MSIWNGQRAEAPKQRRGAGALAREVIGKDDAQPRHDLYDACKAREADEARKPHEREYQAGRGGRPSQLRRVDQPVCSLTISRRFRVFAQNEVASASSVNT